MGLIEVSPDLKRTNQLLERIASALELILFHEHGVRSGITAQPADDPNPREHESIGYENDDTSARRELRQFAREVGLPVKDEDEEG